MKPIRCLRALCAGAALLLAPYAHAQYSWIDDHGTRVFSDRPPPVGTPASRILQAPRSATAATPVEAAVPTTDVDKASPAAGAKHALPTLADREAAYRERTARYEADAREAAETARLKVEHANACTAAREEEYFMKKTRRMIGVNEKGERAVLTDEDKAARLARARRVLAGCPG
ncbi:DUF4124 domain-containing protein [Massilia sp. TW-1]|uniref:DUF4124 domain-containing protein n=1 Tax=Telluria antibiotica TaxID=2717319 RepID=A0ABX0P6I8_9BURK|nr:DUF4124 domain-containing protein [Telluria antibiotica]NIA52560.1 DUF4124 domain-containing protein [Telluria antibiotica]